MCMPVAINLCFYIGLILCPTFKFAFIKQIVKFNTLANSIHVCIGYVKVLFAKKDLPGIYI